MISDLTIFKYREKGTNYKNITNEFLFKNLTKPKQMYLIDWQQYYGIINTANKNI